MGYRSKQFCWPEENLTSGERFLMRQLLCPATMRCLASVIHQRFNENLSVGIGWCWKTKKNKTPCEHEENLRTLSRVSHVSLPWRVAGVNHDLTTHEVGGSLDSAAGRCINGSRGMCLPSSFAVCSSRNNIRVARHLNQFSYQCD